MRSFDVDHRVEGLIGERQVLGVALHEIQAGQLCLFWHESRPGIQVHPRLGGRAQGPYEVRGSAAVAATDLQYLFALEIHLGRRAVVELDWKPVELIGPLQRQGHRRILFVAPIHEHQIITADTGDERIVVLRKEFQGWDGYQAAL